MSSIDLDHMKTAWKKEKGFEDKSLSKADIEAFLHKKSRDISRLFRVGLVFDIVYKGIIGLSFLGILILFSGNQDIILMVAAILLVLIWAIIYQWRLIRRVPGTGASDPVIRTSLENKVLFYRRHYIKSLYVGALSNSLIILSGVLYYFYFKYGEVRPFQWDDYLVFGTAIAIGFLVSAIAQRSQYNFQIRQLESCLQEIDEDTMTTHTIREQQNKKRQMIRIFLLAVICGLLLLAYLIFR
jgi:hypothetical protein